MLDMPSVFGSKIARFLGTWHEDSVFVVNFFPALSRLELPYSKYELEKFANASSTVLYSITPITMHVKLLSRTAKRRRYVTRYQDAKISVSRIIHTCAEKYIIG